LVDFAEVRFAPDLCVAGVPCDLHDICRGAVDELRAAHLDRTIELDLDGDGRGTWDPVRMGQVVSNLVANALQHGAPCDPVKVSVSGDDEVVVGVHNRGPAIAPARLAAIFEPFRTGRARRDPSHARGLGLGLYIVKVIVDAHGGTVAVRSSDEHGTTFTVTLPRATGASAGSGTTAPRASAA
jgi:signal transduction histidine kinase